MMNKKLLSRSPHMKLQKFTLGAICCAAGSLNAVHAETFTTTKQYPLTRIKATANKSTNQTHTNTILRSGQVNMSTRDCLPRLPTNYQMVYAKGQVYYFAVQRYYVRYGLSYCRVFL